MLVLFSPIYEVETFRLKISRFLGSISVCIGLAACGGGGSEILGESAQAPAGATGVSAGLPQINTGGADSAALSRALFANSGIRISYIADLMDSDFSFRWKKVESLGLRAPENKLALVSIQYANTNLPQVALHVKRIGNRRLLVYNHGHGGLPHDGEPWAQELFQKALGAGFDLLITSMPVLGLNTPDPSVNYWLIPWGSGQPTNVDSAILTTWPWMHQLYEIIRDNDSYIHFFIDSIVTLPVLMDSRSPSTQPGLNSPTVVAMSGVPFRQYHEISYVGLSGGGAMGLVACAVFRFDKCILIAGFLPEYLRLSSINNWGDAEQTTRSFYSEFPVVRLLEIARSMTLANTYIYSRNDPCCYGDPAATGFKRDFPHLDIRLGDRAIHGYDPNEILQILSQPQPLQ
jgi:hypothetical protein